ncbi:MAG: CPBP family intramembrane metalloprotease [Muribaculaceae bacterium]|nr:CPBP family intramembrane metalloprotease [Muribaculaceae bacterium]
MIRSTSRRVLALFCAALVGLVLLSLVMAVTGSKMTRGTLLAMTMMQNVLVFIIPAMLVVRQSCPKPWHVMGLDVAPDWRALLLVAVAYVVSIPVLNYTVHLNEAMHLPSSLSWLEQMMRASEDAAQAVTRQLLENSTLPAMLLAVFAVGVMAGVGEEFFFRGAMLGMWRQNGAREHLSVWVVAIVFSAIHLQFYGFVPRMLIGVWLGYLFVWTRSLWVPIAAHALNNSMVVIFSWLTDTHRMTLDIDHVGVPTDGQWPWLALASALGWVALAMMARRMFFGKAPEASRME